jgi:hypothetical protein
MSIQPGVGYTFSSSSLGTNLNIERPWSEWDTFATLCPFTIVNNSSGTDYKFSCVPGVVNSIIPQIGTAADATKRLDKVPTPTTTFNFDSTGYSYIYLKVSADYSSPPTVYPVTTETSVLYPRIISSSTQLSATNDAGFFLLAVAFQDPAASPPKPITITQLTCDSQWTDRIKLGSFTARYYFARA